MNEEEKAQEQAKKMEQLIARTWADEAFKQRLMANPVTVLKEAGLEIPEGIEVRVVEDTDTVYHLVLPPKPADDELSEEELSNAAGGRCRCGSGPCGSGPCGRGPCGPPCDGSWGSYGCRRRCCC